MLALVFGYKKSKKGATFFIYRATNNMSIGTFFNQTDLKFQSLYPFSEFKKSLNCNTRLPLPPNKMAIK